MQDISVDLRKLFNIDSKLQYTYVHTRAKVNMTANPDRVLVFIIIFGICFGFTGSVEEGITPVWMKNNALLNDDSNYFVSSFEFTSSSLIKFASAQSDENSMNQTDSEDIKIVLNSTSAIGLNSTSAISNKSLEDVPYWALILIGLAVISTVFGIVIILSRKKEMDTTAKGSIPKKFCRKCGSLLNPKSAFCGKCGVPINPKNSKL